MEAGEFEKVFSLEKETQLLAEWAPSQYHLSLLAQTEAGEIAASCNCSYSTEKRRYRHRASLGLSVRQDFWRQGLGRRLLEIQEGWCRSQGITKLCLEVDTSNTPAWGCTCEWDLRWREPSAGSPHGGRLLSGPVYHGQVSG